MIVCSVSNPVPPNRSQKVSKSSQKVAKNLTHLTVSVPFLIHEINKEWHYLLNVSFCKKKYIKYLWKISPRFDEMLEISSPPLIMWWGNKNAQKWTRTITGHAVHTDVQTDGLTNRRTEGQMIPSTEKWSWRMKMSFVTVRRTIIWLKFSYSILYIVNRDHYW